MACSPNAGEHGSVNVTNNHQSANECNDCFETLPTSNAILRQSRNERIDQARAVHIDYIFLFNAISFLRDQICSKISILIIRTICDIELSWKKLFWYNFLFRKILRIKFCALTLYHR